jgi:hypothetical protein
VNRDSDSEVPHSTVALFPCNSSSDSSLNPWYKCYLNEQKYFGAPPHEKPAEIFFFTSSPREGTVESKILPRILTKQYHADAIFGTGRGRRVQIHEVPVTFAQIWKRAVIEKKWVNVEQQRRNVEEHNRTIRDIIESQGEDIDPRAVQISMTYSRPKIQKIQLQRHHIPGMLFIELEAGEFIMDTKFPSPIAPDVYFILVDKPGQEFVRCENLYDLKKTVEVEEGQSMSLSFEGIDGKEIKVEIGGSNEIRLSGQGMPRNWDGSERGDLVINVVIV